MKLCETRDPSIVLFKSGNITSLVFGLFCTGLGIIFFCLPLLPNLLTEQTVLVGSAGAMFLILGFGALFIRYGVIIDTANQDVEKWWGFSFIKLKKRKFLLRDFIAVRVKRQRHRSKNNTHYSYPVELITKDNHNIQLDNPRDMLKARAIAEHCAKHIKLTLFDASSDKVAVQRNWDELDLSIRQQCHKHGSLPLLADVGDMPASLRQFGSFRNRELHLTMPPATLTKLIKLFVPFVALLSAVFPIVFIVGILQTMKHRPPIFVLIFIAIIIIFSLIVGLILFTKKFNTLGDVTAIDADENQLTITHSKTKMAWLADDIEELLLLPRCPSQANLSPIAYAVNQRYSNSGIMVRSDTHYATFAYRFTPDEQEWLYKTLYAILAGKN